MQTQIVTLDVLKPIGTIIDLSDSFNARVGDKMTSFQLFITENGMAKDLKGMHPELEATVGNGALKGNQVIMAAGAKGVHWVGSTNNVTGYNQLTLAFPAEVFPQSGFCYGHLILANDAGVRETSVDIWFQVLDGTPLMGMVADHYDSELQLELAKAKNANAQFSQEMRDVYNQQVTDAQNALTRATSDLDHLAATTGNIQAQIIAQDIITRPDYNKLVDQIDDRLSKMNLKPERFADLDAVKSAYPKGTNTLIVTDDGYQAVFRGGQWQKGSVYQAAGLSDHQVKTCNTDFATHQINVYEPENTLTGIYNIKDSKVIYQSASIDDHYGDFTCFKTKVLPNKRIYTVSGTDFNLFGATDDGTLAWSDNQPNGVKGPYTFTVPNGVAWLYVTFLTGNYEKYNCFVGGVDFDGNGQFLLNAPLASPLANKIVTPENTTFIEGKPNLFKRAISKNGIYNAVGNKIVFQDQSINQRFGDFTCFKIKAATDERTYTVSGTDFNVFGATDDGTLAWSDNNNDGVTGPYTFTIPSGVAWIYVTFLTKNKNGYKAVAGKSLSQAGYRFSSDVEVPSSDGLEVHVGSGYQYTRLIDAIDAISSFANKEHVYTVYIHDNSADYTGTTYDLLEELGGITYLAGIENTKDNMQGLSIPAFVNLVGVGKVTLNAELPSITTLKQSSNFSTIELKQGNNRLENLTIKIKNGRYAVHDESRDKYPNAYHIFKNVTFIHEGNIPGLWAAPHAYAAGSSAGCIYSYENCVFDTAASGGYPFDMHNYAPQEGFTVNADGLQLVSTDAQKYMMRFGFNGYSPVTDSATKYEACFDDVFLKNIIGNGSILVEPEDSSYNCTNNYRFRNFSALKLGIKDDQIIQK